LNTQDATPISSRGRHSDNHMMKTSPNGDLV
jgi:hypothetical protein